MFIFLGTFFDATSFGAKKACLSAKLLLRSPESVENLGLQSTLRFRGGPKRKVLWRSVFSTDSGLLKRGLALKQAFSAPKLVASHFVSKMLHETVVIPTSN